MKGFLKSPKKKSSRSSKVLLWLFFIAIGFLLVTCMLIPLLPSSTATHPAHHPNINHNIERKSAINNEEFFSQFITHPLPFHIIRNITKYGVTRLVAIGDLHGDLAATLKILSVTNCIDNKTLKWNTKNTVLIQTGDIADRGPESIKIYKLFLRLRSEAVKHNSLVLNLLGNHETLDIMDDFTYTNKEEIDNYGGATAWKQLWSLGNTEIGYFLRNMPTVLVIGNTVFCHAGLRSIALKALNNDIEIMNEYARLWLTQNEAFEEKTKDYDEWIKKMMVIHTNGPLWTRAFEPRLYLIESGLFDEIKEEYTGKLVEFAMKDEEVKENGLKKIIELYMCKHLQETFDILNVSRMVKGHDPQGDGKIADHCNGRLFIIDVGISKAYGGHTGAIEIDLIHDVVHIIGDVHKYA